MKSACLFLLAFTALSSGIPAIGQSSADLISDYGQARVGGYLQVHKDYLDQLTTLQAAQMKAANLPGANAVDGEIQKVRERISKLGNGDVPSVPGLFSDVPENEVPEVVRPAQEKFLERLKNGVSGLNQRYLEKVQEAQKRFLTQANLKEANHLEEVRLSLVSELEALENENPGAPAITSKPGESLLDPDLRNLWNIEKGDWIFSEDQLTGVGDSAIRFQQKIRVPFELSFNLKVVKGMRPRIHLGPYKIANEGNIRQLLLTPSKGGEKFLYKQGETYAIRFVGNRRFVEFWVNDKLVERREKGIEDSISEIGFQAGDGWSAGTTEFSNIRLH